jgi:hypothetical protein
MPTKLLMGKKELAELNKYISEQFSALCVVTPGPARSEFMGMAVYEMDDDSFLGFA